MTDPLNPAEARARMLLALRLVRRHGLSPDEALTALDQAHAGLDGPHTHLASAEATEVLDEMCGPLLRQMRDLAKAVAPVLQAIGATVRRLAEQLHNASHEAYDLAPPRPRPRDRPSWQSPYGPPSRRNRR